MRERHWPALLTPLDETPNVVLTKTVGTTPGVCAGSSSLAIRSGTPIYYCYTLQNNGSEAVTTAPSLLDRYYFAVSNTPEVASVEALTVPPGESRSVIVAIPNDKGQFNTTTVSIESSATWTLNPGGTPFQVQSTPTVVSIVAPNVKAELTVTNSANAGCSTTTTTSQTYGAKVYFCLKLTNTGDITLTTQTISVAALGIKDRVFNSEIGPGQPISFTSNTVPELAWTVQSATATFVANATSSTAGGLTASATSAPATLTDTGSSATIRWPRSPLNTPTNARKMARRRL